MFYYISGLVKDFFQHMKEKFDMLYVRFISLIVKLNLRFNFYN